MSEFNFAVVSDRTLRKDSGNQGNDRAKHQNASTTKQAVELPKFVSSKVHYVKLQDVQQQSYLRHWHSVRQMQYRLLILVYLLIGLSLTAVVLGVVNGLTLHSLQEELTTSPSKLPL